MNLTKKQIRRFIIWGLAMLLLVRLVFFLPDGSNETIESILIWLIFGLSIVFLGYLIYQDKDEFINVLKKYSDKFYILYLVVLLELGLMIKNSLGFNQIYIFSIILMPLIVIIVSLLIPRKVSRAFDIIFILIYSIYVFSQDYYYRIFDDFFSFKEYGTIKEGLQFSEGMYEFSILHVYIVFVGVGIFTLYILDKKRSHLKLSLPLMKNIFIYPFILFFLANINAQFPVNLARLHLSDHYLYSSVFSREKFVSRYGAVNLLFKDGIETITPNLTTKRDIEYIDDFYENNVKIHTDNDYTGIFEGMNLVFVIGESFDSIVVDETLTPNIYKIKSEGIDLQNHFTPVFPRTTCDSEVIFNTSIIPSIQDGPTCYIYNDNSYNTSLAELFNNQGYITSAFHSNYKEFYTRDFVYDGFLYDNFYGQHEIGLSETEKRYDSTFFEKSIDYSIHSDEPFFSSLLTLSGHSPYDSSNIAASAHYDEVDARYGDTVPESVKYFIASQMETDVLIGDLIDYLDSIGILDNTIIVLTNDHYPYALDQNIYETYKNIEEDFMKNQGVMYIWGNNIEHLEVSKVTSSFDFLPTMLNLFGLDGNYSHYVGNDIFSDDNDSIVYFKDYSIYDGEGLYELSSNLVPSNPEIIQIATDYYELSKKLLSVDYFKKE